MKKFFEDNLSDHQEVFSNLLHLSEVILEASELIVSVLNKNGKIIFCGNGGSASDSQHLAAEFVGRFNKDRISLPAISLTGDSAVVTAIANDYGYEKVFSRQLEGLGLSNDVIFCRFSRKPKKCQLNQFFFLVKKSSKLKNLLI